MSQVDIAKRLGVSTATVSRLLQRARTEGSCASRSRDLVAADELGAALRERLGLKAAAVVEAPVGRRARRRSPGRSARCSAGPASAPGSVLAIGWGRAIRAILDAGLPPIPGVLTVPGDRRHAAAPAAFPGQRVRAPRRRAARRRAAFRPCALPALGRRRATPSSPIPRSPTSVALWDRIDVGARRHRPAARAELARGQRRDARRAGAGQRRRRRDPPLLRRRRAADRLGRRRPDDRRLADQLRRAPARHRRRGRDREGGRRSSARSRAGLVNALSPTCAPPTPCSAAGLTRPTRREINLLATNIQELICVSLDAGERRRRGPNHAGHSHAAAGQSRRSIREEPP